MFGPVEARLFAGRVDLTVLFGFIHANAQLVVAV